MYIEIDRAAEPVGVYLREPEDFQAFKVVVRHAEPGFSLAQSLAGLGTATDDGHAFLQIAAVKALAGERAEDPGWIAGFDQMVAYAARSGWLSEDDQAILAHCEIAEAGA
jgi:hypothetical protein